MRQPERCLPCRVCVGSPNPHNTGHRGRRRRQGGASSVPPQAKPGAVPEDAVPRSPANREQTGRPHFPAAQDRLTQHSCVGVPVPLKSTSIWTMNQREVPGVKAATPAMAELSRAPGTGTKGRGAPGAPAGQDREAAPPLRASRPPEPGPRVLWAPGHEDATCPRVQPLTCDVAGAA